MQVQTQWVTSSDQQRLYVKTWGNVEHPALVLVHGYPDNQEVWERVIQHLVDQFYIVTYDVRGAGQSSTPKTIQAYALSQLSQDLQAVVNAVLAEREFHLAAHDWGSIQSWESVTDIDFGQRILSFSSISGPCLDHAAYWMREQLQKQPRQFLKQLSKSWYIMAFHLPLIAPTLWRFFKPKHWGQFLQHLEQTQNLPLNGHIAKDGLYGVKLYRANFTPRLSKPRQRFAQCAVQAIVLKKDNFVSPALIDEMPKWTQKFQRVDLDANHWAILSQPEQVAQHIQRFIQQQIHLD